MDYERWLEEQGNFRCILVEQDYVISGVTQTACFSNAAFVTTATDTPAHTAYDPFVIGSVQFERSLNEVFTGMSISKTSDIELIYQAESEALLTKAVQGQATRIFLGDRRWPKSDFQQIITGLCDDVIPEQTRVKIKFRDAADVLKTPLLTERYSDGAAAEQLKPFCLGRCFNIKPVLVDAALHKYQFSTGASHAVRAVRVNGVVVPGAHYNVDLLSSTLTFTTYPQGEVSIDADGCKVAGTWLQTAADFIGYVAASFGLVVDCSGLPAYQLGLYLTSDKAADQVLDEICTSVGGFWFFDRLGNFKVRAFNGIPAVTAIELTKDQTVFGTSKPRRVIPPVHSITLGYKRNWTPLSNIAAVVHETTPAVAVELAKTGKTKTRSQNILGAYPQAKAISVESLLVAEADAATEADRRLALAAIPRYIYELQQLSAPFVWQIGAGVQLEAAGINGASAVITKLVEAPVQGTVNVEYWQ